MAPTILQEIVPAPSVRQRKYLILHFETFLPLTTAELSGNLDLAYNTISERLATLDALEIRNWHILMLITH